MNKKESLMKQIEMNDEYMKKSTNVDEAIRYYEKKTKAKKELDDLSKC